MSQFASISLEGFNQSLSTSPPPPPPPSSFFLLFLLLLSRRNNYFHWYSFISLAGMAARARARPPRVPRASPARRHLHAAKRPRDSCRRRRWRRREGRGEGGIGSGDSMNRWRPIFSTKFFFHKRRLLSISGNYLMGMSRPCDVGGGGGQ